MTGLGFVFLQESASQKKTVVAHQKQYFNKWIIYNLGCRAGGTVQYVEDKLKKTGNNLVVFI